MNYTDGCGWIPVSHSAWEKVVDRLPKPWANAAAESDLAYFASKGARPDRVVLARRWGWTEHKVRALLESFGGAP